MTGWGVNPAPTSNPKCEQPVAYIWTTWFFLRGVAFVWVLVRKFSKFCLYFGGVFTSNPKAYRGCYRYTFPSIDFIQPSPLYCIFLLSMYDSCNLFATYLFIIFPIYFPWLIVSLQVAVPCVAPPTDPFQDPEAPWSHLAVDWENAWGSAARITPI